MLTRSTERSTLIARPARGAAEDGGPAFVPRVALPGDDIILSDRPRTCRPGRPASAAGLLERSGQRGLNLKTLNDDVYTTCIAVLFRRLATVTGVVTVLVTVVHL
jgi:hypothetical protein